MSLKRGDILEIHCYKHNGVLHKVWDRSVVLEDGDDYLVVANENVLVRKCDGKSWRTKEVAILFFYKDCWFNVIAQLKRHGLYYYCNISSPYVVDGNIIKFIDYDLDLRVFSNGAFKVLDRNEYNYNKRRMMYSIKIMNIIDEELNNLIAMKKSGKGPFDVNLVSHYLNIYKNM